MLDPASELSYTSGMRVLITTSTFPLSEDDGTPRFVYDLAKAMSRSCQVTVLAPHAPRAPRMESVGALTIRRFQYSWPARTQCLAYGDGMRQNLRACMSARVQVPGYLGALGLALHACTRRERFDVINSHWMVPQGLAVSAVLGKSSSVAHVITAHAGDVAFLEKMAAGQHVARFIASRSHLFLPVSVQVEKNLRGLIRRPIVTAVQPMGVDCERFAATPTAANKRLPFNGDYLLFVGRLVEKKGLAFLLEALHLLPKGSNDPGLVVIGSGALQGKLERTADQLGVRDRVMFMGRMGHEAIMRYLHGCAAVVMPSIVDDSGETEGMPTVLAEALSAGCKVVASRVGGIPDVLVDGRNGWLATPGDAADLAVRLAAALTSSDDEIQRNARKAARRLDWSCVAESYLAHFKDALAESRGRGPT